MGADFPDDDRYPWVRELAAQCNLDIDGDADLRIKVYLFAGMVMGRQARVRNEFDRAGALNTTERHLAIGALDGAIRLFDEALPKFDWGASPLDANAIALLNEIPPTVRVVRDGLARIKDRE